MDGEKNSQVMTDDVECQLHSDMTNKVCNKMITITGLRHPPPDHYFHPPSQVNCHARIPVVMSFNKSSASFT